jgi:DNA adenine methylase
MKPLLKWAGAKNKMKEKYRPYFWPNQKVDLFVDAFYGAGTVTHWAAEHYPSAKFIINDRNEELIKFYRNLRDNPDDMIRHLKRLESDYLAIHHKDLEKRAAYYEDKRMTYVHDYDKLDPTEESAYLHFMMKISFNGWWKVYEFAKGRYSTCRGSLGEKTSFINYQLLKETSKFFKDRVIDITNVDFAQVERGPNTYVYCDPPYRESYGYEYQAGEFNDDDQKRLCKFMLECHNDGCAVSMSNREVGDGFWSDQMPDMEVLLFDAKYTAANGPTLIDAQEVLIRNFTSEVSALERLF